MSQITISLPYPVSANVYWRTRVAGKIAMTYVSNEAKKYKAQVLALARAAGVRTPIKGRVQIEIWLYPNRPQDWKKRQRDHDAAWDDTVRSLDLDNCHKVLFDALKNIAFEDDAWVRRINSQRMAPDEHGPRVVVRITKIETPAPQGELLEQA